jgi:hypothetical protein
MQGPAHRIPEASHRLRRILGRAFFNVRVSGIGFVLLKR